MVTLVSLVLFLALTASLSHAFPTYTLVPLGEDVPFGLDPLATSAADARAIGLTRAQAPGNQVPVFLTAQGPRPVFPLLDAEGGIGNGLCGPFVTGNTDGDAFLAVEGEPQPRLLPAPGEGTIFSAGADVSCGGTVVGRALDGDQFEAVLWPLDGAPIVLPRFESGGSPGADAVNEAGDATGSVTVRGQSHCALWLQATGWAMEDCHADPAGPGFSFGMDINASQHVVGPVMLPGVAQRGFLREPAGDVQILAPLDGLQQSLAAGITDTGLIVGTSFTDPETANRPFPSEATLWQDTADAALPAPVALASLVVNLGGCTLRRGIGVSEAGVLLVQGDCGGTATAFLAIPTTPALAEEPPPVEPEPTRQRRPRAAKARTLKELVTRLAKWRQQREVCLGKLERWEEQVTAWKARHGQ
jgi:hypothetical protein